MAENIMSGNKGKHIKRLKSWSEVEALSRLSERDSETTSAITAGGGQSLIDDESD